MLFGRGWDLSGVRAEAPEIGSENIWEQETPEYQPKRPELRPPVRAVLYRHRFETRLVEANRK